jgi:hypothetical protein
VSICQSPNSFPCGSLQAENQPMPGTGIGNTRSRLTGSGIRVGIHVLKFCINPAFPVPFLRAHHGPHLVELIGVGRVRLAATMVVGVSRRRYAVTHGQILLHKPRRDQTRSAWHR